MKHGFSFDTDLCVNCKACSMACFLENDFQVGTRSVYSYNPDIFSGLSVLNLSLACNHCDEPACLTGCPAQAYTRDKETGVIIHDPEKCIGCSFCTWRCPFDAPKMNVIKGHIEKCNFCLNRLNEGIDPACVTACPTGALRHISIDGRAESPSLLPKTLLNPSLKITGKIRNTLPDIFPPAGGEENDAPESHDNNLRKEWSLIVFSLLVTLAAGFTLAGYIGGKIPGNIIIAIILMLALSFSFLHLGKISKAWRAIINTGRSPLSREILIVSVFAMLAIIRLFYFIPVLNIVFAFSAFLSLVAIDLVYISTDKSRGVITHSGQTLFSGLLLASYFSSSDKVFVLLTFLAFASAVFRGRDKIKNKTGILLFYLRQVLLVLPLMSFFLRYNYGALSEQMIVLTGILVDRVLFYLDFRPINIRDHIQHLFITEYEKERNKQPENSDLS
jgi:Fe-S-cluster-containing dehydrogenase component